MARNKTTVVVYTRELGEDGSEVLTRQDEFDTTADAERWIKDQGEDDVLYALVRVVKYVTRVTKKSVVLV